MTLDELLEYQPFIAFTIDSFLMARQEDTGIGFDREGAELLVAKIDEEMQAIASEIEPQLPPRPLNQGELKSWSLPAKPWKKDGTLSSTMEKWLERTGAKLHTEKDILLDGEVYPIIGGQPTKTHGPMRLANQEDLKNFLLESGWIPTLWNLKKDQRGKPVRDDKGSVIQTTPKFQENGKLCPNLEEMAGELVRPVVRWLSLRSRKSTVEGWLGDSRLEYDGRLSPGSGGVTPTFRQRHKTIANLPKSEASVVYGTEVRSLFIPASPGNVLVGFDASGLENRCEAHYVMRYPGGEEHAEKILRGDPHSNNAFLFYPEELHQLFGLESCPTDPEALALLKKDPAFAKFRGKAKSGLYALNYGCSPAKLAKTLGFPESRGQQLYEAYWDSNPALKTLKDRLEQHWQEHGKKKIRGIDGRWVMTRSRHSLVNTLFQSCGSAVMEYAIAFLHKWLGEMSLDSNGMYGYSLNTGRVYRVLFYHDELLFECTPDIADDLLELGKESIRAAGRYLKMRVPMDAGGSVGVRYSEVH